MGERPVILDNQRAAVAEYLRACLEGADLFRIVSAYFSVFGYETLAEKLESASAPKVRFLFGAPDSADDAESGDKTQRVFALTESGLSANEMLHQRELAERCAAWIQKSTEVRKISRQNFLHGKMYHLESNADGAAVVGSSNFTRRGMGMSRNPNIEINLATTNAEDLAALAEWFDEVWEDEKLTEDAKPDLLAALKRWTAEYAPEFLYYKVLYELFRNEIRAREQEGDESAERLDGTEIWKTLYEFQKDGARTVVGRLLRHGGCILADSVGLGKTYTALAAIKYFEMRNKNVLVLCPKKLEQNWRLYQASAAVPRNPFVADKFGYHLLSHTDLGREKGKVGNIDLSKFDWGVYDLVVIDESHNFRNDSKSRSNESGEIVRRSRYETLLEDVIKTGEKTKVLMLSATPVNNSLTDLRNQIYLMTGGREDVFADSLGVRHIKTVVRAAQRQFHEWEKHSHEKRDKGELLASLGDDFLNLLAGVTIARSRRQIKNFYADFIARHGDFPKREKPQNEHPHADSRGEFSYDELHDDLLALNFHIYRPSDYVVGAGARARLDEEKKTRNFNQKDREKFLVAMMRVNFLKRLESSAHACKLTLERTLAKTDAQIEKINNFLQRREEESQTELPGDSPREAEGESENEYAEDEDFVVNRRAMTPYRLSELDVEKWRADMAEDRRALRAALDKVQKITPERDGKIALLKKQIAEKAKRKNRKLLVFTAFKDTAEYLYNQLRKCAEESGIKIAFVAGDETSAGGGRNAFPDILNRFSPRARGGEPGADEIDLLIATDCISEGQNLQDCDTVLNYDIHWNPVRLIQRFGRVDRIGSTNKSVRMINYWPTEDMDFYLKLENRVRARMALADIAGTGDDDALNEKEMEKSAQQELHFRNEQLKQMREKISDMEEMDDSVTMSDLTLDYFITQLLRYLQKNKDDLEAAPPGIYAVANAADGEAKTAPHDNGAIFLFRRTNAAEDDRTGFYLVHCENGKVRAGHLKVRETLRIFESLAKDKNKPLKKLCDIFSRELKSENGARFYDKMANAAVCDIGDTADRRAGESLRRDAGRGGMLPKVCERPAVNNLELVAWLVVKKDEIGATELRAQRTAADG